MKSASTWSAIGSTKPTPARIRPRALALVAAAAALVGCGSERQALVTREGAVTQAARTYVADVLSWQSGDLEADEVRYASPEARRAIASTRRPPASIGADRRLVDLDVPTFQSGRAMVTATVRNETEGLTYELPLTLTLNDQGKWQVADR